MTATTTVPQVEITGLHKRFKRRSGAGDVVPIDDVTLSIAAGEFVVLLGPSGCGKTTLLRSIAGLERPDAGRISITGTDVFDASRRLFLAPNKRPISMIFQSYALWPHMTVFQNIAYPIKARRRASKQEVADSVHRALAQVGLKDLHNQYPGQLSGGQQQRVALARALVTDAKVLLFDEPLSNVDAKVREELRVQLVEMQRELGFTAVYVTHDQAEAMELADRIAVLNSGRIEQLAAPREVYGRPASRYVAEFVGVANLFEGIVAAGSGDTLEIDTTVGRLRASAPASPARPGEAVVAMFRPEDVVVTAAPQQGGNVWSGTIAHSSFSGAAQTLQIDIGAERIQALADKDAAFPDGSPVAVRVEPAEVHVLSGGAR